MRLCRLAFPLVFFGCDDGLRTVTLVTMTADAITERRAARMAVRVVSQEGEVRLEREARFPDEVRWPSRVPVVPQGNDASRSFTLEIALRDGAGVTFQKRTAKLSFLRDTTLDVHLHFSDLCLGIQCGEGSTCEDATCVSTEKAPTGPYGPRLLDDRRGECTQDGCYENPRPGPLRPSSFKPCMDGPETGYTHRERLARFEGDSLSVGTQVGYPPALLCAPNGSVALNDNSFTGETFDWYLLEGPLLGPWTRTFRPSPWPASALATTAGELLFAPRSGGELVVKRAGGSTWQTEPSLAVERIDMLWGDGAGNVSMREVDANDVTLGVHKRIAGVWSRAPLSDAQPSSPAPAPHLVPLPGPHGLRFASYDEHALYHTDSSGKWVALPPVGMVLPRMNVEGFSWGEAFVLRSPSSLTVWNGSRYRNPVVASTHEHLYAVALDPKVSTHALAVGGCGVILERIGDQPWRRRLAADGDRPLYEHCRSEQNLLTVWAGNDLFLVGGDEGIIASSTTGSTFRVEAKLATPRIHSIHGRDLRIAAGGDLGALYLREPAGAWTRIPFPLRSAIVTVHVMAKGDVLFGALDGVETARGLDFEGAPLPATLYRYSASGGLQKVASTSSPVTQVTEDPDGTIWYAANGLFRTDGTLVDASVEVRRFGPLRDGVRKVIRNRKFEPLQGTVLPEVFDLAPMTDGRTLVVGENGVIFLAN